MNSFEAPNRPTLRASRMTFRSRSTICHPTGSRGFSSGSTAAASSGRHVHLCPADEEPEVLEQPADLVLNITLDLDRQSLSDKKDFDCMTIEIFDAHLLEPSTLHDACNAHGVVTVALVAKPSEFS